MKRIESVVKRTMAEILNRERRGLQEKMEKLESSLKLLEKVGKEDVADKAREAVKNGTDDVEV